METCMFLCLLVKNAQKHTCLHVFSPFSAQEITFPFIVVGFLALSFQPFLSISVRLSDFL